MRPRSAPPRGASEPAYKTWLAVAKANSTGGAPRTPCPTFPGDDCRAASPVDARTFDGGGALATVTGDNDDVPHAHVENPRHERAVDNPAKSLKPITARPSVPHESRHSAGSGPPPRAYDAIATRMLKGAYEHAWSHFRGRCATRSISQSSAYVE